LISYTKSSTLCKQYHTSRFFGEYLCKLVDERDNYVPGGIFIDYVLDYDNIRIGVNSRLDTIQAAILLVKLKAFVGHELEDVNRAYQKYNDKLNGIVATPVIPDGFYSSFAQYTIKLKNKEQRDGLQKVLKDQGIPSMIYYSKPMHKQGAFGDLAVDEVGYPVTDELCDVVLSLPMHPYLTDNDICKVCDCIIEYIKFCLE